MERLPTVHVLTLLSDECSTLDEKLTFLKIFF